MRHYQDTMSLLMQKQIDFKPAFDQVFTSGQLEMAAPRQEALIAIDKELTLLKEKQMARNDRTMDITGLPKVLPEVQEPSERVRKKLDKIHGE